MSNDKLKLIIEVDGKSGEAALKSFGGAVDDVGRKGAGAFQSMGGAASTLHDRMTKLSGILTAIAGAGAIKVLADGFMGAARAASDLQEVSSKFATVFKGQEQAASRWAKQLVDGYAMSTREAKQYMGSLQDLLKPMGLVPETAAKMSFEVTKLAADLGSFNNLPTAQVIADMQSALVGNYETMKKYGVVLNESAVKQEALNMGLVKGKEELSAAEKAAAAYSLILKGTTDAQGDLARTGDSYANTLKAYRANIEDLTAALGEALLPALSELIGWLGKAAKAWKEFVSPDMGKMVMDNLQNQLKASQLELAKMEGVAANKASKTVDKMLGWLPGYVTQDQANDAIKVLKARIKNISTTLEKEYAAMAAEQDKKIRETAKKISPISFTKASFSQDVHQAKEAAQKAKEAEASAKDAERAMNDLARATMQAETASAEAYESLTKYTALEKFMAEDLEKSLEAMRRQRLETTTGMSQKTLRLRQEEHDQALQRHQIETESYLEAIEKQEAAQKAHADEVGKIYDTMTESIQTRLSDAFQGMWGGWQETWAAMKSWALKTLADIAAAAMTRQIVMPVVFGAQGAPGVGGGGLMSMFGGGAQGGGFSLSGIGSLLKTGFSNQAFSGLQSNISGFALDRLGSQGLSQFIGGMSPALFGGALSGFGGLAMGLLSGKGVGQSVSSGLGAGLGFFAGGPLGAMAGGFLGDMIGGSLFGKKEKTPKLEMGAGSAAQIGRGRAESIFGAIGFTADTRKVDTHQFEEQLRAMADVNTLIASFLDQGQIEAVKQAMEGWDSKSASGKDINGIGEMAKQYFAAVGGSIESAFGEWLNTFGGTTEELVTLLNQRAAAMAQVRGILTEDEGGSSYAQAMKAIADQFSAIKQILDETGGSAQEYADLARAETKVTEQAQTAFAAQIDAVNQAIEEAIHPMSGLDAALSAIDRQFDAWIASLKDLGASLDEIAAAEENRTRAIAKATDAYNAQIQSMLQGGLSGLMTPQARQAQWATEAGARWAPLYQTYGGGMTFEQFQNQVIGMAQGGQLTPQMILQAAGNDPDFANTLISDIGSAIQYMNQGATDMGNSLSRASGAASDFANELKRQTDLFASAIGTIDDLIFRLTGGDLAAVQSAEFFQNQYAAMLQAAQNSPENMGALAQFVPQMLGFMGNYGTSYADLNAGVVSDLQSLRSDYQAAQQNIQVRVSVQVDGREIGNAVANQVLTNTNLVNAFNRLVDLRIGRRS